MGRAKGGRRTRRGSGAAGHPPATGPQILPQSPCHPGRAQNAPEPAGPGPCPCPGREPVSAPLRALAQPSAQPAAPRRSPSGSGAQPSPKHSPRRADGGGWSPPAAAAPRLTSRRCKWPTGKGSGGARERRKCGSGDQWAAPRERPNGNDGGGRAWQQLHHAPSKDGGSLKGPRTPRRTGPRDQHARCDGNGHGAGGYTVPKGSLRTAGYPVPFHTAQAGRPCSAMGPSKQGSATFPSLGRAAASPAWQEGGQGTTTHLGRAHILQWILPAGWHSHAGSHPGPCTVPTSAAPLRAFPLAPQNRILLAKG